MSDQSERSSQHLAAARARLADLGSLSAHTADTERRIMEAAEHRLQAVQADLDKLRLRVNLDPAAVDQYSTLVLERGQLSTVIAQSRATLRL